MERILGEVLRVVALEHQGHRYEELAERRTGFGDVFRLRIEEEQMDQVGLEELGNLRAVRWVL